MAFTARQRRPTPRIALRPIGLAPKAGLAREMTSLVGALRIRNGSGLAVRREIRVESAPPVRCPVIADLPSVARPPLAVG